MQLRISPGGSMLSSLRSRPLEPPSSLTVTTALSSPMTGCAVARRYGSPGAGTKLFRPFNSVERPVPPPMATTRNDPEENLSRESGPGHCWGSMEISLVRLVRVVGLGDRVGSGIGVEQFGKARIFGQVLEVGIVARLEAERGVEPDSRIEIAQRVFHLAGHTVKACQTVNDLVGFRPLPL